MEQLNQRFANKPGSEGSVDWPRWLQYYAFDVIGELTYSERHGFLEGGKDIDGIIAFLSVFMSYLSSVSEITWDIMEGVLGERDTDCLDPILTDWECTHA
jgi:hypothetical protein